MILKNYRNLVLTAMNATIIPIPSTGKNVTGAYYNFHADLPNSLFINSLQLKNYTIVNSGKNTDVGYHLGYSEDPVTEDDYTFTSLTGFSSTTPAITCSDDALKRYITFSVVNNNDEVMNITDVYYTGDSYCRPYGTMGNVHTTFLFLHEKLSTPVTLQKDEAATITITLDFSEFARLFVTE